MLEIVWDILGESAIFILIGFLVAGLLEVVISSDRVVRFMSGNRKRSVVMATLVGVPLPLCSCSVLPTAVTLRKKGASKGATLSFLISTPETSITSVLLTYGLLGPFFAIFRPIAACVTALTAGLLENAIQKRSADPAAPADAQPAASDGGTEASASEPLDGCCAADSDTSGTRLSRAMRYAFVDLFDDIFGWILVGIAAAAAIQVFLPPDVLSTILGGPLQSMLLMVLIGVPLYVCAEASTPIAAVLLAAGMDPGAALVFLLVGPATNIGSLGVLMRHLGRRTVIVYLAAIVGVGLLMGVLLNYLLAGAGVALAPRVLDEPFVPAWLKSAGAVVFLLIGVVSIRRAGYAERFAGLLRAWTGVPASARGVSVGVLALVIAGYVGSGLYVIQAGEIGIHRRFGAILDADVRPGLHYAIPYPIDSVDRVAVRRVRRTLLGFQDRPAADSLSAQNAPDAANLVGDENLAAIRFAVHWGADAEHLTRFRYGVGDAEELTRNVVLAAAREVYGGVSINRLFTADRTACEQRIERLARQRLSAYESGIRIDSVRVLDAHAPSQVHAAFRDVASALEDRATRMNKARGYEARLIPEARGEAVMLLETARGAAAETRMLAAGRANRFLALLEAYRAAPEVTERRLELEALERVLPGMRKYIKPSDEQSGGLEIWFVDPTTPRDVTTMQTRP